MSTAVVMLLHCCTLYSLRVGYLDDCGGTGGCLADCSGYVSCFVWQTAIVLLIIWQTV
jgi:hypothetical protein